VTSSQKIFEFGALKWHILVNSGALLTQTLLVTTVTRSASAYSHNDKYG